MLGPKREFNLKRKIRDGVSFAMKGQYWLQKSLSSHKTKLREMDLKEFLNLLPESAIGVSQDGVILIWNNAAESLFGWTAKEALGKKMDEMIIPEEYRELHNNGMKRFLKTKESRVSGKYIDLQAVGKSGNRIPVKLFISPSNNDYEISFVGFLHENSKEIEVQQDLDLKLIESEILSNLMTLVTGDFSLEKILEKSLGLLAEPRGWVIGHVFEYKDDEWKTLSIWKNSTGLSIRNFVDKSKVLNSKTSPWCDMKLGKVNQISWVANVQDLKIFKRHGFCREFGLKGAVTIPIKIDGETRFVMEFFSLSNLNLTPKSIKFLSDVSAYIGKAVSLKI